MDSNIILVSIFTGAFGAGYLVYGIKQRAMIPLLSGVILSGYSFFIPNIWVSIGIGVFFTLLPWFWKV